MAWDALLPWFFLSFRSVDSFRHQTVAEGRRGRCSFRGRPGHQLAAAACREPPFLVFVVTCVLFYTRNDNLKFDIYFLLFKTRKHLFSFLKRNGIPLSYL